MRYLDYWMGVPLCFIFSISSFIFQAASIMRKRERTVPRKILLVKLSELGAIVLAYPLMRRIKEEYPSAEMLFLTFEKNREVFKVLKGIVPDKNVLTIREDSIWKLMLDSFSVMRRTRKERVDIVFDLEFFSRLTAIMSYLSKADKRIGFHRYNFEGLYRGSLLTHKIQYNPLINIAKTYLSLCQVTEKQKKFTPDLEKVIKRLKHGESVLITCKPVQEQNLNSKLTEKASNPSYFQD